MLNEDTLFILGAADEQETDHIYKLARYAGLVPSHNFSPLLSLCREGRLLHGSDPNI